jgi:hypothetical protein
VDDKCVKNLCACVVKSANVCVCEKYVRGRECVCMCVKCVCEEECVCVCVRERECVCVCESVCEEKCVFTTSL